jgi:hypothetical protein
MKLTGRLDGIREGMCWMNELIASKLRALGLNAQAGKDGRYGCSTPSDT